jgi:hypothetical protein
MFIPWSRGWYPMFRGFQKFSILHRAGMPGNNPAGLLHDGLSNNGRSTA